MRASDEERGAATCASMRCCSWAKGVVQRLSRHPPWKGDIPNYAYSSKSRADRRDDREAEARAFCRALADRRSDSRRDQRAATPLDRATRGAARCEEHVVAHRL